jgi:hypothetical protein
MKEYEEVWPQRLKEVASAFTYPPTPDVAAEVRRRLAGRAAVRSPSAAPLWRPQLRWAWLVAAVLLALAGLIMVPQVRAAVRDFLQIGAVRIFEQPLPEQPAATGTPAAVSEPVPARETLLALAAETTLAGAQAQVDFALLLPAHPADLGRPDRVFVQPVQGGQAVIMIWLEPNSPGDVKLALYQIQAPAYVSKFPATVQETAVNGHRAVWLEGGHRLYLAGRVQEPLVVAGNVLLWSAGDVTYRLESGLPLAEAVRIAESLAEQFEPAPDSGFENCPVTLPTDSPYIPPPPYPATAPATNAYHPDFHWAILTGLRLPSYGCWAITGSYHGSELGFVVWGAP